MQISNNILRSLGKEDISLYSSPLYIMKTKFQHSHFLVAGAIFGWVFNAHSTTVKTLTQGWYFQHGELQESDFEAELQIEDWQSVIIPHDWAIGGPFETAPDIHGGTGRLPWQESRVIELSCSSQKMQPTNVLPRF